MININNIVMIALAVIGAILTYFAVPWFKEKTTNEQQQHIQTILRTLMGAAEVYFTSEQGAQKKEWVIEKLGEYGINSKEVGNMIEGMYRQLLAENVIGTKEN